MSVLIINDYPGANVRLISAQGSTVFLEQEIRDSTQWWFYWNFCVQSDNIREVLFQFKNGDVVGPFGPAISKDGVNWYYKDATFINHNSFRYRFSQENEKVYFSFSIPYQFSDFSKFYEKNKNNPILSYSVFTTSEKNREIPLLNIGNTKSDKVILLTCRHHACEANASYVLEGVMDYLLNYSNILVRDCLFHIIPFVDIDGAEEGDQGKERYPHDHNRDYTDEPIYNIIKQLYLHTKEKEIYMGFDFHCPWKWGDTNDYLSIVRSRPPYDKPQAEFSRVFENVAKDSNIEYYSVNDIGYGVLWNTGIKPDSASFFYKKGAKLAFALETPYFGDLDKPYSQSTLRETGRLFAIALEKYYVEKEGF